MLARFSPTNVILCRGCTDTCEHINRKRGQNRKREKGGSLLNLILILRKKYLLYNAVLKNIVFYRCETSQLTTDFLLWKWFLRTASRAVDEIEVKD